jgi:hypothetical protein
MNKTVTMKHLAVFALVLVALILVSANWDKISFPSGAGEDGKKTGVRPNKIPFDMAYVQTIGGWENLSDAQRAWARQRYLKDLRGLYRILQSLQAAAMNAGQAKRLSEIENAMGLVLEATNRLEHDPTLDPTTDIQWLINEVNISIRKP